jgi:type II secretion system protein I
MSRQRTRSKAFTFIEALIALTIASVGLLGLLRLHLVSMATADVAAAMTQAVFVAEAQMAEASAPGFPKPGTTSGAIERNGQQFTWKTEVQDVARPIGNDLVLKGLREVSTTVTWQHGSDRKAVKMTTLVADGRIHEQITR